jgi:hypothetical protein
MARVPKVPREIFLACGMYCCPSFSPTKLGILWSEYIYIYVQAYRLYMIIITAKWSYEWKFFYTKQKRWDVIGCLNSLPNEAFNYFVLSLPAIIFKITIMIYKYNNNEESRHQYQSLLLKTPMGTQKKLIRKLFTIWSRALKRFASPGTDSRV